MDYLPNHSLLTSLPERNFNKGNLKSLIKSEKILTQSKIIGKVVNASECGDMPIQYTIKGLLANEHPVIGVYVDPNIIPGFKYKVRCLEMSNYLFNNEARYLLNVGTGYAKRITFQGSTLNNNKNYFWSDNQPKGYGFSLQSIEPGFKFTINLLKSINNLESNSENDNINYDDKIFNSPVGEAIVEFVHEDYNEEIDMKLEGGYIFKYVWVKFDCEVSFIIPSLKLPIKPTFLTLEGKAIVRKNINNKSSLAELIAINDIFISNLGKCHFIRS